MRIKIKKIEKKDVKKAFKFTAEIFEEMGWDKRFNHGLENLAEYFSGPREAFFLAKEENKIIGSGGIKELSKNRALLKRFYINKDFRGKGLSQRLFKSIKDFAQKQGYKVIVLDTFRNNFRAKNFYKKMGFKRYYPKPDKKWRESEYPDIFEFRALNIV